MATPRKKTTKKATSRTAPTAKAVAAPDVVMDGPVGGIVTDDGGRPVTDDGGRPLRIEDQK